MAYFHAPVTGRISSNYGTRRHPITGAAGFHRGLDIAAPAGTPVVAAYAGTVRAVRTDSFHGDRRPNPITGTWNTGNFVLVDGPGGGSEWYGHLETVSVKPGQWLKAGQKLGTVGQTGNVTGPHLHLETWSGRDPSTHHDPRLDYARHGIKPGEAGSSGESVRKPVNRGSEDVLKAQRYLAELGFYVGALDGIDGAYYVRGVNAFVKAQRYAPGLLRDGVAGPAFWAHVAWTKRLQRTLNAWKGYDIAVDGHHGNATRQRVLNVQRRNHGGAYGGTLDAIPGPVFCRMLGIPTHPGL